MSSLTPNHPDQYDQVIDAFESIIISENGIDPDVARIHGLALSARLKSILRNSNTATRSAKALTAAARQDMDQSNLGLQNLHYEKRHLEREIEKCRQFATIYQDVPLYSMEDFKRLAPPEAQTEEVLADDHQLLLNRLSFEFVERQRLDKMKKEMIQEKEELLKGSKMRTTTQDSITATVEGIYKTAVEGQKKVHTEVSGL
ncbi:THO complex subunit 5 [Mycena indigotica]|uniref:THO complex subunit 5 n=1 Tax=Mycena indigotica TaxID=2126181 RepID=A0A8H6SN43_9AGAR|nr:THO complex subunit 5 [Mycena indigotica]KAF7301691.1 THO complex subunit 5 [Mycena indigotica]